MKTTAFLIRVALCLLLSLIPTNELENRIYSTRMGFRLLKKDGLDTIILTLSAEEFQDSENLLKIRTKIETAKPLFVAQISLQNRDSLHFDSDGVVRRAKLLPNGTPSLALSALRELDPNTKKSPKINESHLINFMGPAGTFPRCKFTTEDKETCSPLVGKTVLLVEENKNRALLHTPIGDMSFEEVVANDVYTILHHRGIYRLGLPERLLITLSTILLGAFYIIYYPVLISAIAISGTGVAMVLGLFQILFQLFDIYIPSANIILALLITYLIFTGYRLALQENIQWRALKQAQYLQELDRMKTNFLSLVSHDFKTPLAKIQAVVERLRRELPLSPEDRSDWKELIDSIENSNNEMKRFITSILNLSKMESKKIILNKKSNDINLLIQQALARLRPLAQQKNLTLIESLDPLFSIECDEDLMRQVLTNLIDNAIKYSPENSKIIVRSKEEGGFVRVEVEDFGPGIPKDELPLMFRKFTRFLRPIKEHVKGTGLGLYLSKYFIELHGGTIRVKSIEGQGTVFSFTLPFNETLSS